MKHLTISLVLILFAISAMSQNNDEGNSVYQNTAEIMLNSDNKLSIGGYGEVHYNQPLDADLRKNGALDVHRFVMFLGYNFSKKVQFITEVEYEHVSELYVEQAFLQYKLNQYISFRGGLLLIPMGIVNEFHEPTTFNGVERPLIDNKISPSTWREIGFGISGNYLPASVKYQLYLVNGFNGYDGAARLNGKNGFRSGRQKGAESYISSPNLTGKVEYYGIRGLNLGLSAYIGNTQSTLYNNLDKSDNAAKAKADSSVVGMSMIGLDGRYQLGGWHFRGQYYYASISNTLAYNHFTSDANGNLNDLGSSLTGYYVEAGYNVLRFVKSTQHELVPFIRYEFYDTQNSVETGIARSKANEVTALTTGLSWMVAKGAVVKVDMQFVKPASSDTFGKVFNAGFGVMF